MAFDVMKCINGVPLTRFEALGLLPDAAILETTQQRALMEAVVDHTRHPHNAYALVHLEDGQFKWAVRVKRAVAFTQGHTKCRGLLVKADWRKVRRFARIHGIRLQDYRV